MSKIDFFCNSQIAVRLLLLFFLFLFLFFSKNACGGSPCKNNAICQSGFTRKRYRCLCSSGFAGHDCEHGMYIFLLSLFCANI